MRQTNNGANHNGNNGDGDDADKKFSAHLKLHQFRKFMEKKERAARIDGIRNLDNGTMLAAIIESLPEFDRKSLARYADQPPPKRRKTR